MEGSVIPWLVRRQKWVLWGEVKGDELEGGVGGRMGKMGRKCEGLNWWDGVRSKMGQ